jgi:hypothetical protein
LQYPVFVSWVLLLSLKRPPEPRPTVEDVEIVNCQGSGIDVRTGNSGDGNAIVFEPIFSGVSIMSCNVSGMTMTYCADDALYSVNVENCSNDGIRYYGGNGKWTDVHVYDNRVGIRIGGQPLRLVSCSLDTNKLQGAIVENFDKNISPGKVIFDAILAQGNGREASDPLDACAIQLLGSDAVVQNLIAINKPGMDWQKYSIVEKGSADGNAVIDFGVDPMIAQHCVLIGQHTTLNMTAVPDLPGQSGGGGGI